MKRAIEISLAPADVQKLASGGRVELPQAELHIYQAHETALQNPPPFYYFYGQARVEGRSGLFDKVFVSANREELEAAKARFLSVDSVNTATNIMQNTDEVKIFELRKITNPPSSEWKCPRCGKMVQIAPPDAPVDVMSFDYITCPHCGIKTELYPDYHDVGEGEGEEGWTPSWVEKHSVNCIKCGVLFDEREGIPGPEGEGTLCPECMKGMPPVENPGGKEMESNPKKEESGKEARYVPDENFYCFGSALPHYLNWEEKFAKEHPDFVKSERALHFRVEKQEYVVYGNTEGLTDAFAPLISGFWDEWMASKAHTPDDKYDFVERVLSALGLDSGMADRIDYENLKENPPGGKEMESNPKCPNPGKTIEGKEKKRSDYVTYVVLDKNGKVASPQFKKLEEAREWRSKKMPDGQLSEMVDIDLYYDDRLEDGVVKCRGGLARPNPNPPEGGKEMTKCPNCKNIVLEEVKSNPPGALKCPACGKGYMRNPPVDEGLPVKLTVTGPKEELRNFVDAFTTRGPEDFGPGIKVSVKDGWHRFSVEGKVTSKIKMFADKVIVYADYGPDDYAEELAEGTPLKVVAERKNPRKWSLPKAAQPSQMHYHGKGHSHRHAGLAHENPYDPFATDNPDAGVARERKYTSQQDWEQAYRKKRVSRIRYYKKRPTAAGVPAFVKANPSKPSATGGRHYTPAEKKAIMSTAQFRAWKSARGGAEPDHGWFHAFMTDVGKSAQLKGEKKWPAETMFSDRQGFEHPKMKRTYHKIGEFAKRKKNPEESPEKPAEAAPAPVVENPPAAPATTPAPEAKPAETTPPVANPPVEVKKDEPQSPVSSVPKCPSGTN